MFRHPMAVMVQRFYVSPMALSGDNDFYISVFYNQVSNLPITSLFLSLFLLAQRLPLIDESIACITNSRRRLVVL